MASKLDLTNTLRSDDVGPVNPNGSSSTQIPISLIELQHSRMVQTNDSHGVSYSLGNRAMRRMVGRGDSKHRGKQVHKQSH